MNPDLHTISDDQEAEGRKEEPPNQQIIPGMNNRSIWERQPKQRKLYRLQSVSRDMGITVEADCAEALCELWTNKSKLPSGTELHTEKKSLETESKLHRSETTEVKESST